MSGHTSAPWNPYRTFAHLVESTGASGIRLSPEDYDYAAKCVNAHEPLYLALREMVAMRKDPTRYTHAQEAGIISDAVAALKLANPE